MRLRDIEAAIAVFRHGAFSRAAEALGTSQPAVSMAVQRIERYLNMAIFDRTGSGVRATAGGAAAIKAFLKITDILDELKAINAAASPLKIAVTPLLSGRDVVQILRDALPEHCGGFDVEFSESNLIQGRQDLDIRISLPSLRKKSAFWVELPIAWIGVDNGVLIVSKQETEIWEIARRVLLNSDHAVTKVISVNDCGYAYHMAAAGAGFTPCVMTRNISFRDAILTSLPPMPAIRLDIFAEFDAARRLKQILSPVRSDGSPQP